MLTVVFTVWIAACVGLIVRRWWVTRDRHVDNRGTVHYGGGVMRRLCD
jgi:hypothetical protein